MFDVGDRVVYPHHGAAIVTKKEMRKAFGEKTEYLVLEMAHGEMTLSVPVDKVEEVGMRWPISTEDVEDLFEVQLFALHFLPNAVNMFGSTLHVTLNSRFVHFIS